MMTDYFRIAWRNLKRRRLRSWLTIVGIVISIAIIFILVSLSLGLEDSIEEQFRQLGTDKFFVGPRDSFGGVSSGGAAIMTKDDVEVIERLSGVRDISYWTVATGRIEFSNTVKFTSVVGVPLDQMQVFIESGFIEAEDGEILERGDSGKAMIGSQFKYNNYLLEPVAVGDNLKINEEDFRVKGILESVGSPPDDQLIYMGIEEFRPLFPDTEDRVDQIAVQVEPGEDLRAIADRTEEKLLDFRELDEETRDFTILTPEELLETLGTVLNIMTGFLLGVAGISLLVGGIGIANTMYTSVIERTREIGVMKAVGARNSDVLKLFTVEAGLIGLIGGVFGVLFGIGFVKLIELIVVDQFGVGFLQAAMPPYLIIGCLIFSFGIGALSGMFPARQASKIRPVDALRYE